MCRKISIVRGTSCGKAAHQQTEKEIEDHRETDWEEEEVDGPVSALHPCEKRMLQKPGQKFQLKVILSNLHPQDIYPLRTVCIFL
jgi:hypothetical protein